MEKVRTAVKLAMLLVVITWSQTALGQRYGKCGYGKSTYNKNRCAPLVRLAAATALDTAQHRIVRVYPNPAGSYCMLQLAAVHKGRVLRVQLFNEQQELMLNKTITAHVLLHKIDLPLLANGLYQVTVTDPPHSQTILLNIQN
jgi:hypothetical protein